jgi:hypothetical protein
MGPRQANLMTSFSSHLRLPWHTCCSQIHRPLLNISTDRSRGNVRAVHSVRTNAASQITDTAEACPQGYKVSTKDTTWNIETVYSKYVHEL